MYHILSPSVTKRQQMSQHIASFTRCHKLSQHVTNCHKISLRVNKYHQMLPDVAICCRFCYLYFFTQIPLSNYINCLEINKYTLYAATFRGGGG